ncbi:MAG: hypothetical protein H6814_11565 [Phycisphaeraceae bacterium]|nr:hypothetical protein [Phycisphaeraceae bacterium]
MPNIGGKIWFTAIAGTLLGFVLYGMIQRGCDAQGEATFDTSQQTSEQPPSRDYNATARNNEHTIDRPVRSNTAQGRRNGPRAARDASGRSTRTPTTVETRAALERSEQARGRADAARRAELARLTRERTQRYRDRARRARADDPNSLDPVLRSSTTGVGLEDAVAQAAAEAGADLRGLRGEGGAGSGSSGGGDVGGSGEGGSGGDDSGAGDNRSGDGDNAAGDDFGELSALLAGLGLDQSFINLIQQVVSGAIPPVNPFDNSSNNNNNGGGDTDPIDQGNGQPVDTTTPVLARWVPVEQTGCGSLASQGLETRDLYLAFLSNPGAPPVLSSKDANSIVIVDGSFYQSPFGSNGPPVVAADDCSSYDTYLTVGRTAPVFITAPDPADWGQRLSAEWFALPFGVDISQDRSLFGDNRYYMHVGRFTAEAEAKIFGALRLDGSTGVPVFVTVPDWKGADTDGLEGSVPPPLPKVASVRLDSTNVLGGSSTTGAVFVDRPAPVGGMLVSLITNKPNRLLLPSSVLIPEGQTSATFEIGTIPGGVVETATITALTSNSLKTVTLVLQAPAIQSFQATVSRLLTGQTTTAVIRLTHAADQGGAVINLSVDNPEAVTIPSVARIPQGQFRTVITIQANDINAVVQTIIHASAGGATRNIAIEIIPTLATVDVNNDGRIDTADLGSLLGAFGSSNAAFDFNGDGVVDTADLGILNQNFGKSYDPGGGGPDDNPGGGAEDAVIARWIEVDQGDCGDYPGARTVDLFIGFLDGSPKPVITSDAQHGIQITGGEFKQHPFGSNNPPAPVAIDSFPCLAFDSFLSIGGKSATFLDAPDPANWGARINAIWFTTAEPDYQQDPARFGDNRRYLRIGRFTAETSASVFGSIRIDYNGALAIIDVPNWNTASAVALDLNFDGQVDATDVAMVTRGYGTTNSELDINGDGVVNGEDLRPLLDAIQNNAGL